MPIFFGLSCSDCCHGCAGCEQPTVGCLVLTNVYCDGFTDPIPVVHVRMIATPGTSSAWDGSANEWTATYPSGACHLNAIALGCYGLDNTKAAMSLVMGSVGQVNVLTAVWDCSGGVMGSVTFGSYSQGTPGDATYFAFDSAVFTTGEC